jgi:hypothetical protein
MSNGLEIALPFTTDRQAAKSVLGKLAGTIGTGHIDVQQRESYSGTIQSMVGEIVECSVRGLCGDELQMVENAIGVLRQEAEQLTVQSEQSLHYLKLLLRSLPETRMDQSVVYVSDGFPMNPGRDMAADFAQRLREGMRAITSRIRPGGGGGSGGGSGGNSSNQTPVRDPTQAMLQQADRAILGFQTSRISDMIEELAAVAASRKTRVYSIQARANDSGMIGADISGSLGASSLGSLAAGMSASDNRAPLDMMAASTGGVSLQGSLKTDNLLQKAAQDTLNQIEGQRQV